MIVQSFRSVMWVGAVAGAALSCYMVSLRVASERASLERVESRILMAKRDIRALDTELSTRGRLRQLERWNVDVLALSAPTEGQFLGGEVALASLTRPMPRNQMSAPLVLAVAPEQAAQGEAKVILADFPVASRSIVAAPDQPRLVRASVPAPAKPVDKPLKKAALAKKKPAAEAAEAKLAVAKPAADAKLKERSAGAKPPTAAKADKKAAAAKVDKKEASAKPASDKKAKNKIAMAKAPTAKPPPEKKKVKLASAKFTVDKKPADKKAQ